MKVVALNCNQCGASLEVGARTRFVTCSFCNTKLRVHHSSNAHYSEVLEAIEKKTDALAQDVAHLKRQSLVEEIDEQWETERKQFMVESKQGTTRVPTVGGSIAGGILIGAFGAFWTVMASSMDVPMPSFVPLFGVGFALLGVVAALYGISQANKYHAARRAYELRRKQAQES